MPNARRWESFQRHRDRVTSLCVAAARGGTGRLSVLGAGNCNDVDLPVLLQTFREVHLVDLDSQALQFGVERQLTGGSSGSGRVVLHGGVDMTGIAERLAAWSQGQPPQQSELRECAELASSCPLMELAEPFDVVASVCLLSQLIDAVRMSIGANHPQFVDLALRVRAPLTFSHRLVGAGRRGGAGFRFRIFRHLPGTTGHSGRTAPHQTVRATRSA